MIETEKTCQRCGDAVIRTARFCPGCGTAYPTINQVELIHKINEVEQLILNKKARIDQLKRLAKQGKLLTISGLLIIIVAFLISILVEQVTGMVMVITGVMVFLGLILLVKASSLERPSSGKLFHNRKDQENQRKNLEDELAAANEQLSALRGQLDPSSGGQRG